MRTPEHPCSVALPRCTACFTMAHPLGISKGVPSAVRGAPPHSSTEAIRSSFLDFPRHHGIADNSCRKKHGICYLHDRKRLQIHHIFCTLPQQPGATPKVNEQRPPECLAKSPCRTHSASSSAARQLQKRWGTGMGWGTTCRVAEMLGSPCFPRSNHPSQPHGFPHGTGSGAEPSLPQLTATIPRAPIRRPRQLGQTCHAGRSGFEKSKQTRMLH